MVQHLLNIIRRFDKRNDFPQISLLLLYVFLAEFFCARDKLNPCLQKYCNLPMRNGKVKYIDGIWRRSVWVFDLHWDWDLDCILDLLLLSLLLLLLLLLSSKLKVSIYLSSASSAAPATAANTHRFYFPSHCRFFGSNTFFAYIQYCCEKSKKANVRTNERARWKIIEYKYPCTNNSNRQKYIFLSHVFATEQIEKERIREEKNMGIRHMNEAKYNLS